MGTKGGRWGSTGQARENSGVSQQGVVGSLKILRYLPWNFLFGILALWPQASRVPLLSTKLSEKVGVGVREREASSLGPDPAQACTHQQPGTNFPGPGPGLGAGISPVEPAFALSLADVPDPASEFSTGLSHWRKG